MYCIDVATMPMLSAKEIARELVLGRRYLSAKEELENWPLPADFENNNTDQLEASGEYWLEKGKIEHNNKRNYDLALKCFLLSLRIKSQASLMRMSSGDGSSRVTSHFMADIMLNVSIVNASFERMDLAENAAVIFDYLWDIASATAKLRLWIMAQTRCMARRPESIPDKITEQFAIPSPSAQWKAYFDSRPSDQ